jgi:hypothetical protein
MGARIAGAAGSSILDMTFAALCSTLYLQIFSLLQAGVSFSDLKEQTKIRRFFVIFMSNFSQ